MFIISSVVFSHRCQYCDKRPHLLYGDLPTISPTMLSNKHIDLSNRHLNVTPLAIHVNDKHNVLLLEIVVSKFNVLFELKVGDIVAKSLD